MLKVLCIITVFMHGAAFAAKRDTSQKAPAQPQEHKQSQKILDKINAGIVNITDMKVSFRQKYDDQTETGHAEFKRNHGIYIHYDTMPVTLMTNKDVTVYYDSKMDQKSEIPTKDSATKIFTGTTRIDNQMFDIISTDENEEAYSVKATVKRMKSEGIITMYFSKTDMLPRRIDIQTPEEKTMRIDLYSHKFETVSPERFKTINIKDVSI